MYCPECRAEYREEIQQCSDCEVELLAGRPPDDSIRWVEIRNVATDSLATLIAGFLRAEGVNVVVENIRVHAIPETFGDLAEIRILVPEEEKENATGLLQQREKEFAAAAADDEAVVTDDGVAHIEDDSEVEVDEAN